MSLDRREFLVILGAGAVLGLQTEALLQDFGDADAEMFAIPPVAAPEPAALLPHLLASTESTGQAASGQRDLSGTSDAADSNSSGSGSSGSDSSGSDSPADSNPANSRNDAENVPSPERKLFAGRNLDGWRTALGDARHTASGLEAVNIADIASHHQPDASTLVANTAGRGVMAHNITYLRRVDEAMDYRHTATISFRTPSKPEAVSGRPNAQTFETALFVWDGAGTRRDIGLAMQWMLNPWHELFGAVRTWTSDGADSRWSVEPVAWLDPSADWHSAELYVDPRARSAALTLDGKSVPAQCTETVKPDNWARTSAAALQVELVSLWPDQRTVAPTTAAECKDWSWTWDPQP